MASALARSLGLTDKELNRRLTELLGRRVQVGYRGGKVGAGHGLPLEGPHSVGGFANRNVGRVKLPRASYMSLLGGPNPSRASALGILAHELGHIVSTYKGTPNDTGGLDYDPLVEERGADKWALQNMRRIVNSLGYKPLMARAAKQSLLDYRKENPFRRP